MGKSPQTVATHRNTKMSQKPFHAPSVPDDDAATLLDDGQPDKELDHVPALPASVMYIPEEGKFGSDLTTLFDGQEGSSQARATPRMRALDVSVQQLHYNENKTALDRSINDVVELLYELSTENQARPVFYPAGADDSSSLLLNSPRAHLALVRNKLSATARTLGKTKIAHEDANKDDMPEFRVLKLNLKMGHGHGQQNSADLVSSLDKQSIATLLELKFHQQIKYLLNLKDRIDDTSSKVFVTGDLNAGKSTFCNALLRRKVLPEDQQPCTSVFCEVIDAAKENRAIEAVHAVLIGTEYNIKDTSTYETFELKDLDDLVYECDKYGLLKVYVLDRRAFEESLLRNGVIDIKLIDAPGLNMDLYQTTQVFSRQEEIDLVVFVVNAENHFTLSAKEFIAAAAAEKRYVFIVVNKFDNIKDKNKCIAKILDQVKGLSPDSHKNAKDFVHFVSSSEAVDGLPDGDDGGDDDPEDRRGNPDFDDLEASLRKFILEKRSISKLLPAKSYLVNLLNDLETLSTLNEKVYLLEKESKLEELTHRIAPKYDEIMYKSVAINDSINKTVESLCNDVYNSTKSDILNTVNHFGDDQVVAYRGLQFVFEYAKQTQKGMIDTILSSVQQSEEKAKIQTSESVEKIIKYGQSTLGDEFLHDKVFKPDLMFTRRRDTIKKTLNDRIEVSDFIDPSLESILMWLGVPREFVSTTTEQIQDYNPVTMFSKVAVSATSLKSQIPTQITLRTLYTSTKILTTGAIIRKAYSLTYLLNPTVLKRFVGPAILGISGFTIFYLINDIPNAFPRKQARKIKKQILEMDYAHVNADRVAKECRLVLNYPSRQVMNSFQTSIDKRSLEKEEIEKSIKDAELSSGYFRSLLDKISQQKELISEIDLERMNSVE